MFAVLCRRRLRAPLKDCIFVAQRFRVRQNAVLIKSCSSSVCENASQKSFTLSYLINSCGLSSKEAIIASNKVSIKSPENSNAVLELLRKYGFTNAHIHILVTKSPNVLSACPNNTLLPKLEFFRSIGVPLPVLAQKISLCPAILGRSLDNSLVPSYNDLKSLLRSDERVVHVFSRAPRAFTWPSSKGFSHNISMLRERGVPESSIVSMVMYRPLVVIAVKNDKFAAYIDRAIERGFDVSKSGFIQAVLVFVELSESTIERKMEVYRRCGWSESDIKAAFLRQPVFLKWSEKKIVNVMDFLVDKFGCKPGDIAECPVLLCYNLENRIKPRCLVAKILNEKGLMKTIAVSTLLVASEKKFLEKYIDRYKKDIPELLDIYRGKLSPIDIGFSHKVCNI